MSRRRGLLGLAGLLVAVPAIAVLAIGPGRLIDAAELLGDVRAAMADPRGREIARQRLSYTVGGRARVGDLYRGGGPGRAALVLVPGATPLGLDDPALAAFADALADNGFFVLVPRLTGDNPVRVSAADAAPIADALAHITARYGAERAGLAAISYAAGPAFLAVLEEPTVRHLAFLVAIGGYYDITAAVTYLTTGMYRPAPDAPWRKGPVDTRAKWRFLLANADRVTVSDARLLRRIARLKLREPAAEAKHIAAMLGAAGRAALRLLTNTDPARVPGLLAALPRDLGRALAALDLARHDLSAIDVPVLLVHGRDDPMIPPSESRALARALPHGSTEMVLLDSLLHIRLRELGVGDVFDLLRVAYRLVTLREHAAMEASE